MSAVALLLVVALLDSAKGSKPWFVKCNTDLVLDVTEELNREIDFVWKINKSVNVVKFNAGTEPKISDKYKKRVEFLKQNNSLVLKNVQQNDSGIYTAIESGDSDKTVARYNITVQAPVSPVNLIVSHKGTHRNSSVCNLTVTCKTEDFYITRTLQCYYKNCSLVEEPHGETAIYSPSLNIYVDRDDIICNHSNQVSWEEDKKPIEAQCRTELDPSLLSNTATIALASTISFVFLVLILVLTAVTFHIVCKRKSSDNTVYEVPQDIHQKENQYENSGEVTLDHPSTTYDMIQLVNHPEPEVQPTRQPETVYAQVTRAGRSQP